MRAGEGILVAWALAAAGFSIVAVWRLRRARVARAVRVWPPVVVLRPIDAPSEGELRALAEPLSYPGALRHIVLAPVRPPLPAGLEWWPSDPRCANRKVGHLLAGMSALRTQRQVVLALDGDVLVDEALVRGLVSLVVHGAGLAWALPVPQGVHTWHGRAARALLTRGHLAFDVLSVMRLGAPTVCGKAMALGPAALALLPEVADAAGEDLALATRLWRLGARVETAAEPARVLGERGSARDVVERFTRWLQVLRAHRPALAPSVPLLVAPTPLLMLGAAAARSAMAATALLGLAVTRAVLAWRLASRAGRARWPALWEWLMGEALLLAAFVIALGRRTLVWRGRRFAVAAGGRLHALDVSAPGGAPVSEASRER